MIITTYYGDEYPEHSFDIPIPESMVEGPIKGIFLLERKMYLSKDAYDLLKSCECTLYIESYLNVETFILTSHHKTYRIPSEISLTKFRIDVYPTEYLDTCSYGTVVSYNTEFDRDFLNIRENSNCRFFIGGDDRKLLSMCRLAW